MKRENNPLLTTNCLD